MVHSSVIVEIDGRQVVVRDADLRPLGVSLKDWASMGSADRCSAMIDAATPPVECGDGIRPAPGRGPMATFHPRCATVTDAGNVRVQRDGYKGRTGARVADVFDLMTNQARRAHSAKGPDAGPFVPPFTYDQVRIAREYQELVEFVSGCGLKMQSLDGSGGGSHDDISERTLAAIRRLRHLQARIGRGIAKEPRKLRPSRHGQSGVARVAVMDRVLVDNVCLSGRTISEVASSHGWAKDAKVIKALRAALCDALDRMGGFRPVGG